MSTAEVSHTDYATYRAHGGYKLAAAVASAAHGHDDDERIIKAMEDSGLRGLGGAGFPAGRKWRIVPGSPSSMLTAISLGAG